MRHTPTVPAARPRRIEQIGSLGDLPGVRRLEWHEADEPDGCYWRMPLPDVVCTINLGVVGEYRLPGTDGWRPFPRVAWRGIASRPSEGRDPPTGQIGYVSLVISPWAWDLYAAYPAVGLANTIVDGATCDPGWHALYETVAALESGQARLQAALRWLSARAGRRRADTHAAAVIEALRDDQPISQVAATCRRSPRRIHQRCVELTGQNPSTYRQIARFARMAHALHEGASGQPWTRSASEYADHSHAIRAFRALAHVTPREYLTRAAVPGRPYSIVSRHASG